MSGEWVRSRYVGVSVSVAVQPMTCVRLVETLCLLLHIKVVAVPAPALLRCPVEGIDPNEYAGISHIILMTDCVVAVSSKKCDDPKL